MCLEFYRQAGLDYNASNIEFHFLSSGGGNGCDSCNNTVESWVNEAANLLSKWRYKYVNARMNMEKIKLLLI